ncbi:MAG: hypothetical protein RL375_1304, partial [Pseudomonadota bacterium]
HAPGARASVGDGHAGLSGQVVGRYWADAGQVLGSAGMLQCGNHTPSQVVQWDAQGVRADKPEAFFLQRYAAAYKAEIAHFFDCLQTGAAFRTTVADGVKAQILADAATESANSGQPIRL